VAGVNAGGTGDTGGAGGTNAPATPAGVAGLAAAGRGLANLPSTATAQESIAGLGVLLGVAGFLMLLVTRRRSEERA